MAMSALERCKHFGVADIKGIAYMPGPSNYVKGSPNGTLYEDSDFYSNIFEQLWGYTNPAGMGELGRRDLERFKAQLGVNFIHCYDWSAPVTQVNERGELLIFRTHIGFLNACHRLGMKVSVPISNYTIELLSENKADKARRNAELIFSEAYSADPPPAKTPLSSIGMWKIFNEYELWFDQNPQHVVTVISWLAEWEAANGIADENALPVTVCTSFGMSDGIEGAGYLKNVHDVLMRQSRIGRHGPGEFWANRVVFATNPQREGFAIVDYLETRLPQYWQSRNIPQPPVMFTELGSSIEQTGGERQQAEWLKDQIAASAPGRSCGQMLGACIFLNEERPWEKEAEAGFGIMRFGPDKSWPYPDKNAMAPAKFPIWDPRGWYWQKEAAYPVEQQAPKLAYQTVADAWKSK